MSKETVPDSQAAYTRCMFLEGVSLEIDRPLDVTGRWIA